MGLLRPSQDVIIPNVQCCLDAKAKHKHSIRDNEEVVGNKMEETFQSYRDFSGVSPLSLLLDLLYFFSC